jgi:hypothetical protein
MSEQNLMPPQCQGGSGCTCCGPDCDCGCIEKCPAYKRLSAVYVPPRNQGKTMMSEIQAGDGWRLIDKAKDTPQRGDQFHDRQVGWQFRPNWPLPFDPKLTYRRRIPAKPEAMEINNAFQVEVGSSAQLFQILQSGPPDEAGDVVIGNATEARQLADWLTRYADWREAQDSK